MKNESSSFSLKRVNEFSTILYLIADETIEFS